MNKNPTLNTSGCKDMTAYEAISNVSRAEKTEAGYKPEPPMIYICSPLAGDIETNVANALKYCRFAVEHGYFPIAPHCYLPRFMNDGDPAERELAMSFGLRLLSGCRELWIFGSRLSEGMKREVLAAKWRGIKIKQFSEKIKKQRRDLQ